MDLIISFIIENFWILFPAIVLLRYRRDAGIIFIFSYLMWGLNSKWILAGIALIALSISDNQFIRDVIKTKMNATINSSKNSAEINNPGSDPDYN